MCNSMIHSLINSRLSACRLRMSLLFRILIVAVTCGDSVLSEIYFRHGAPHAKLGGGILSGNVKFSREGRPYNAFLGIPYANVLERFQAAQPITEAWEGVKSTEKPGNKCPEPKLDRSVSSRLSGEIEDNEDCLNLNVYVPMSMNFTGKRGFAVMVWIHGGGFLFGSGIGYGEKYFMDEDVILVTTNYRLGVFGFLSTGDDVIPGNYGMKDQVMALKWVKENIQGFGGDPNKITIFGESAGGASVHFLMLSPSTKGLFQRAISQSGSALGLWAFQANPRDNAVQLATYLKCPTTSQDPSGITSQEILICLNDLPLEELRQAQFTYKPSFPDNNKSFFFVPTAEPATSPAPFLTESPISILMSGKYQAEVPWLVGATEDEGCVYYSGIILNNEDHLTRINTEWESLAPTFVDYLHFIPKDMHSIVAEKIRQFYFGTQPISLETRKNLTNLNSDSIILHSVYRAAVETAARGKRHPVYLYQYAYQGPVSLLGTAFQITSEEASMVGHGDDVLHQFNLGLPSSNDPLIKPDSPDEEFSKNFIKLWTSFAIHGELKYTWGNGTLRKFKDMSKKEIDGTFPLRWFRLDSNPTSVENPYRERMAFWDDLWASVQLYPYSFPKLASTVGSGTPPTKVEL